MGITENITDGFTTHGSAARQPVFTLNSGETPVIIAGPHNGHLVPEDLYDEAGNPLGLHPSSFDPTSPFKRHETCDWGMAALFDALQTDEHAAKHNFISAQYSRLVVDLNRAEEDCITRKSSENGSIIPLNNALNAAQSESRIAQYYHPYHTALKQRITDVKATHGHVVFIEMHSFTPRWNGQTRDVEIGTLSVKNNDTQSFVASHINAHAAMNGYRFASNYPYDYKAEPEMQKVAKGIEALGIDYIGLEIRNDILATPEGVDKIAHILSQTTTALSHRHAAKAFHMFTHTQNAHSPEYA